MNNKMLEKMRHINIKKIRSTMYENEYRVVVKRIHNELGNLNDLWDSFCLEDMVTHFGIYGFNVYYKKEDNK
jgi:hypothetical protein